MGNVVITGANRGIGLALTRRYVEAGDTVLALCRDPQAATDLKGLRGVTVGAIDIADQASVDAAATLATAPVDVLINNAGDIGGHKPDASDQTIADIDSARWLEAFNLMSIGPFRVTRAFLPRLIEARGKVLFVSSQIAASTWPYGGFYGYRSAKAAGNSVAQILAIDLKTQGVIVASVHPGYVQTDMGGPGADITPSESAEGIYHLVAGLTPEKSGGFFKWNGEPHPL